MWEENSYEQHPLHWYLFSKNGWKREEDDSGWPDSYVKIPLIENRNQPGQFCGTNSLEKCRSVFMEKSATIFAYL